MHVLQVILAELESASVPHFLDPVGNLVIGADSQKAYIRLIHQRSADPVRIFIAHMDHPGFHGVHWKKNQLGVQWLGGSPTQQLEKARVWIADPAELLGFGKLHQPQLLESGKAIQSAWVQFDSNVLAKVKNLDPKTLFGGFAFRSFEWREKELIYAQAADDLIGSFTVVSVALDLAKQLSKNSSQVPFLGLLTRAEEVGFIGAIGHFQLEWLKKARRPILCISLETSRTLPGAEIGKGPIIRLGDKFTVFHSGSLHVLSTLARRILPQQHQCRVMDGGTCEASVAAVFGYPCVGMSIPLGNYHNQNFEGGPDSDLPGGPAPEFVHKNDIEGLLKLSHAILNPELSWSDPWEKKMKEFRKNYRHYHSLLQTLIKHSSGSKST
jgi:endoglucanase